MRTGAGLKVKPAAAGSGAPVFQRHACLHPVSTGAVDNFVENSARFANVSSRFGHAFLAGVEFFENDERKEHVVLLKAEYRRRIMHEHIGVEHENLVWFHF